MKAIVFDLGNVVLTNDYPYSTPEELKEFCSYFNVTMDNLDAAFAASFTNFFDLGKCTEDEFWKKYLFSARANKIDINYGKKVYRKNQKENENMLSLLKTLKKQYRLAALSTIPKEWLEFKRKKFSLDDYFEVIVGSGDHGVKKPDPKIYEILIKKLNLSAKEILFVDDREKMLLPAEKLGIKTILFRGKKDLEEKLRKLR